MRTPPPSLHVRVMWIPLVLVGSFLYWTTALGLGGLSLTFLGCSDDEMLSLDRGFAPAAGEEPIFVQPVEPILVHLESWADVPAVAGASGKNETSEGRDGTGSLPAIDDSPADPSAPGQTSY
jgi:hypothetical protein